MLAKSCATVRRETHSPELNAWAFVDTHSPFQADAADGSALEWTMNNCPGSWGHYHLCLTNATAHTTVQHKQSRLLVHKPLRLFVPSVWLSLSPAYPGSRNWLSCLLFALHPETSAYGRRDHFGSC